MEASEGCGVRPAIWTRRVASSITKSTEYVTKTVPCGHFDREKVRGRPVHTQPEQLQGGRGS
jgi:hypothetical protein